MTRLNKGLAAVPSKQPYCSFWVKRKRATFAQPPPPFPPDGFTRVGDDEGRRWSSKSLRSGFKIHGDRFQHGVPFGVVACLFAHISTDRRGRGRCCCVVVDGRTDRAHGRGKSRVHHPPNT